MKYDPIKIWNKDKYLNTAAIKCRFNMLETNNTNTKNGLEIGSHWKKNTPYPLLDDDLLYYKSKMEEKSVSSLIKRNKDIIDDINKSHLIGFLDSIDHTSAMNSIRRNIKRNSVMKPSLNRSVFKPRRKIRLVADNIINTTKSVDSNDVKRIKRVVYDIVPIRTTNEKGTCKFDNKQYNTIDSTTHMKTDTTYEDNIMNTSHENELPKRKGSKIKDLKILLDNMNNNNETAKNNEDKSVSVLKKNPREMYLKKIRIKYIKPLNALPKIKQFDTKKYIKSKNRINTNTKIPERYYCMNYAFGMNKDEMINAEGNINYLEGVIDKEYVKMRNEVETVFSNYSQNKDFVYDTI